MKGKLILTLAASLSACLANTIIATGAGPLLSTAEDLSGEAMLTGVIGNLIYPNGVSLFKISISDYPNFSAFTVPVGAFGVPDTELFLFDSLGRGVYGNDDIGSGNTLSCLPSASVANPCPYGSNDLHPQLNGTFYLAITRSANAPLSSRGPIFSQNYTGVVGPVGTSALIGWDNGVFAGPDFDLTTYQIALSGVAAPEPSTLALLAAAGTLLIVWRHKLRRQ